MLLELLKSFLLIVLGFVIYHIVKTTLLQKPKKSNKNREKTNKILSEFEKKKVQLTKKEKHKMEKELTEYFKIINKQGSVSE